MTKQVRPDELVRILRPDFLARGESGSHTWGRIVLIYGDGTPALTYIKNAANLVQAVEVDATHGSVVWLPPGIYVTNLAIPGGVGVASMGNKAIISGRVTLAATGSHTKGVLIYNRGDSAGAISAVEALSGEPILNDTWVIAQNDGAGDAYGIQDNASSSLFVFKCLVEGHACGGGAGYAVGAV